MDKYEMFKRAGSVAEALGYKPPMQIKPRDLSNKPLFKQVTPEEQAEKDKLKTEWDKSVKQLERLQAERNKSKPSGAADAYEKYLKEQEGNKKEVAEVEAK